MVGLRSFSDGGSTTSNISPPEHSTLERLSRGSYRIHAGICRHRGRPSKRRGRRLTPPPPPGRCPGGPPPPQKGMGGVRVANPLFSYSSPAASRGRWRGAILRRDGRGARRRAQCRNVNVVAHARPTWTAKALTARRERMPCIRTPWPEALAKLRKKNAECRGRSDRKLGTASRE